MGDTESRVVERYEISQRFFSQPGAFALRVGHGGITADLLNTYKPGTPFTLWIDPPEGAPIPRMTGVIDDVSAEAGAGATEVSLRGRDWMAPLLRTMPEAERTFGRVTFRQLVEEVLRLAHVPDFALTFNNDANNLAVQGIPKFETVQVPAPLQFPREVARLQALGAAREGGGGGPVVSALQLAGPVAAALTRREMVDVQKIVGWEVQHPLKVQLGQPWLHFLQGELNRAGLFLFAGVEEKTFILTRPSAGQAPTWRIVRRRGDSLGVLATHYKNNAANRHSRYLVFGRGGGGPDGRKQVRGEFIDQEMVDFGLIGEWSKKDDLAKTSKMADYLAHRQCAEERRAGWELSYTLKGHTWPLLGSRGQRAAWSIDAIVDVQDDEYGIHGPHWIESVTMRGGGTEGSTTTITLMRPGDLVFGDEILPPKKGKKR